MVSPEEFLRAFHTSENKIPRRPDLVDEAARARCKAMAVAGDLGTALCAFDNVMWKRQEEMGELVMRGLTRKLDTN